MVLIDISNEMIKRARKNTNHLRINNTFFVVGDVEHIPVKTSSTDFTVCLQTLIHIPHREKALNEIKRITKEDGSMIVYLPIYGLKEFIRWSLQFGGIKNFVNDILRKTGFLKSYSAPSNRREFSSVLTGLKLRAITYFKIGPWDTFVLKKEK